MNRQCLVVRPGIIDYPEALILQRQLARARMAGEVSDILILLEHPHTITLGRGGNRKSLLLDEGLLVERGVSFYEVERGGDITYHGPGQLVGYPILDLRNYGQDVHLYLRRIEEVVMLTLHVFGISSARREGLTGVWVGKEKIASIGIHVGKWVSWHGFALNVNTDLSYFDLILPCGIEGLTVTSIAKLLKGEVSIEKVIGSLIPIFGEVFQLVMRGATLIDLEKHCLIT